MHTSAFVISFLAFILDGVLVVRGWGSRLIKLFPLFYSYLVFAFCGSLAMYLIYWLDPRKYSSAYWIYYLITILAEFMVLVEISDQIFRSFPAIRNLGRALTILISASVGCIYILPPILHSRYRDIALLDFALRASVTKIIILALLFYVANQYRSHLGMNVGGLMLGFSIYVAINMAILGAAKAYGAALYARVLWIMAPAAYTLCLVVWTVSLWKPAPVTSLQAVPGKAEGNSESLGLELTRFNNELSKFLRK